MGQRRSGCVRKRGAIAALALAAVLGCRGELEGAGEVAPERLPEAALEARASRQAQAARAVRAPLVRGPRGPRPEKLVLFGDLHVHTTFSFDAFFLSLPLMQADGAHPPADACDFARFCADLDFFAITDHAEGITPGHWRGTIEAIRRCNEVAGDPADPDLVAFVGFEWTQVGPTPDAHWGHRNVVLRETDPAKLPARPIAAPGFLGVAIRGLGWRQRILLPLLDFPNRRRYFDFARLVDAIRAMELCPEGIPSPELPPDCLEVAEDPAELFRKLDEWGVEAYAIPHGTTWGFYTPPGYVYDRAISRAQHDPRRVPAIEIYSGHGNSEEYRPWRAVTYGPDGSVQCPAPTEDYEPCCWRAGEIVRARCDDPASPECEERVERARRLYAEAGMLGHRTVPGATVEDWLDCGQCRDCFLPAFNFRPGGSVQYILAKGGFEDRERPLWLDLGLIGSSDNHTARPGTGYKEFARRRFTEARGARSERWRRRILGRYADEEPAPEPRAVAIEDFASLAQAAEVERQASFFLTGGLVAVHARARTREAIWEAIARREVYGTSGDRILLWFDLENAPGGPRPMGSKLTFEGVPRFRVRAVGAFRQRPGCPDYAREALGPERLAYLCRGECYLPSDERKRIVRIEVVRIRRQLRPEEPIEGLIEDPWRVLPCPDDPAGCVVEFEDPALPNEDREVVYYVRAIEEASPAVNGANLRCERDENGRCVRMRPCYGDYRTPFDDDCLAPVEERAWSSPIYLTPAAVAAAR